MINCRHVIQRLWEYMDGELPQDEAEGIRAHLAECARCNPQYQFQFRFLGALVRAHVRQAAARPEFVDRLRATLGTIGEDLS